MTLSASNASRRHAMLRQALRVGLAGLAALLMAPAAIAQGSIVIGRSASLTGPGAAFGAPTSAGARAWFRHINDQGGIDGQRIELVELDDGFDAERMAANTRQLIERHKVQALFLYFGTPVVLKAAELAERERIPLVAPISWASVLRDKHRPQLFPMRSDVQAEARAAVEQLRVLQVRQVAVAYQDDGVGRAAVAALTQALARAGLPAPATHPMPGGRPGAAWVQQLLAGQPAAVVLAGYAGHTLPTVEALRAGSMALPLLTMSTVTDADLATLGERAAGVMNTQPFPHPYRSMLPVALEFRRLMAKHEPKQPLNYASMEGFLAAKVMTEALRRCARAVSRACISRALESLDSVDLGGYAVSYDARAHAGASFVELLVLDRRGRLVR